jgi:hypothetical protein
MIKLICSAAIDQREIMILPKFSDTVKSIGSLIEKKILYWDASEKHYYYVCDKEKE